MLDCLLKGGILTSDEVAELDEVMSYFAPDPHNKTLSAQEHMHTMHNRIRNLTGDKL